MPRTKQAHALSSFAPGLTPAVSVLSTCKPGAPCCEAPLGGGARTVQRGRAAVLAATQQRRRLHLPPFHARVEALRACVDGLARLRRRVRRPSTAASAIVMPSRAGACAGLSIAASTLRDAMSGTNMRWLPTMASNT